MDDARAMELLFELHDGLLRLGPGDTASTLKALELCEHLPPEAEILDLGCGTGAQTLDLSSATDGPIIALDLFAGFLDTLNARAAERGLSHRIHTQVGDMGELPFPDARFDLLWSEGSAYVIGFDRALTEWRRLLRAGGYLVVSELSWFTPDPPDELRDYWMENYPGIRHMQDNVDAGSRLGYEAVASFQLPRTSWTEDYYGPLKARLPEFRARHAGDADALRVAQMTEEEIALMDTDPDAYGYGFFVFRKPVER